MVVYVHIQYSTYQFSEESKGGGWNPTLPRFLRYRTKHGPERVKNKNRNKNLKPCFVRLPELPGYGCQLLRAEALQLRSSETKCLAIKSLIKTSVIQYLIRIIKNFKDNLSNISCMFIGYKRMHLLTLY